ncbi:MAG TPA: c-type cytochrome, partial [Candidatus Hydrogenedentes bacterium]|nr:c-type cytochrome [Candidatus Hydrogenedentota bacterium]
RGRHIFRERCASCHKMGEDGHAVGPDLGAITDRSPQSLLVSILDPNRAVETKYFDFRVETTDLRTINGIVAKESGNSVTLISANGIETELLRSEIETMESTSRSPMPDGLEDGLSVEDMANLIAFILDIKPAN